MRIYLFLTAGALWAKKWPETCVMVLTKRSKRLCQAVLFDTALHLPLISRDYEVVSEILKNIAQIKITYATRKGTGDELIS